MQNKFVIQRKKDEKWCDLDYHDGSEIIYVKSFINAINFWEKSMAAKFLRDNSLNKEDFELFQLKVSATPLLWE